MQTSVLRANLGARIFFVEGTMYKNCPRCGLQAENHTRCPLCDASLVQGNLRRTLLWALVVEVWMMAIVVSLRFG